MQFKQCFIGVSYRTESLIIGLLNLGATLMFRHHPVTMALNKKYEYYDGEWMLYTCVTSDPDQEIKDIRDYLEIMSEILYDNLTWTIVG